MERNELRRPQCIAMPEVAVLERPIARCKGITVKRPPISFQRSNRRCNVYESFASAAGGFRQSIKVGGGYRVATAQTVDVALWSPRDQRSQTPRLYAVGSAAEADDAVREAAALRLSTTPLSEPAQILRRMPAQAITPALLDLLDLMSGPILLIADGPAGELRETALVRPMLAKAA